MATLSLRREDVDMLLAPEFVEGLFDASVDEIRAKRAQCRRVEYLVSYLRRVVQGQIDLVTAELERREHGTRSDDSSLVEDLPSILGRSPSAGGERPQGGAAGPAGGGRQSAPPLAMPAESELFAEQEDVATDEIAAAISPGLYELTFSGGTLPGANLASFANAEVEELLARLREHESSLSAERRVLHERIGQLQAIVVEYYKSGVADADTLLEDHDTTSEPDPGSPINSDSHANSEDDSP